MPPVVATVIGDPCGVGPEVVLKAAATGQPQAVSRPLLIGSLAALEKTRAACGIDVALRAVADSADARYQPGVIDVLDPVPLDPAQIVFGRASAACGEAVLHWLETAERLGRAGAVQARMDQLKATRPTQPVLAANLMGEAKDERTLRGILRQQRRCRRQALGEQQDLGPAGSWLVIVVDRDRAGTLAGPFLERLAVIDEPHRGPIDALDVQDALGGFAPGARDAADHDHAPSAARDRRVDAHVFERHQRTSTSSQKPIQ